MKFFSICSKPECDFAKNHGNGESSRDYCAICGSTMIHQCPHCGFGISTSKAAFCEDCGKGLKDAPQAP